MSRWRPLHSPGGELGDDPARHPRPVGESLGPLARRLGAPEPAVLTAVFTEWDELVGAQVATHVRPLSLTAGALVIGADHPGWATQLRFLSGDLLARLNGRLGPGQIERIEVRVMRPGQA